MSIMITGKDNCPKCLVIKTRLEQKGIKHEYITGSIPELIALGKKYDTNQAPICVVDGEFKEFGKMLEILNKY